MNILKPFAGTISRLAKLAKKRIKNVIGKDVCLCGHSCHDHLYETGNCFLCKEDPCPKYVCEKHYDSGKYW
jgi:uncharacterized protein (DUF2237 family)